MLRSRLVSTPPEADQILLEVAHWDAGSELAARRLDTIRSRRRAEIDASLYFSTFGRLRDAITIFVIASTLHRPPFLVNCAARLVLSRVT